MIKISTRNNELFVIKAIFEEEVNSDLIIKKANVITECSDKTAFIFLGKRKDFKWETMKAAASAIASYARSAQVDVATFVANDVKESCVAYAFAETYLFNSAQLWTAKTDKKDDKKSLELINVSKEAQAAFEEATIITEARNYTRSLQITPPNVLTSEAYAEKLIKDFADVKELKITVLNKKQIEENKMGLLLSVNKGSAYEPRVVIFEYKGDANSKEVTSIVGKGITFDAGGYNIKTGRFMNGMKYDMSGSAIVAGLMKVVAAFKPKSNVTGVLVITDNMISPVASTPDSVWTAMNGKTVEINNTDAEGRLALADGLTYSVKKLGATRLVDVATLTGAVIAALGNTYTGVWTTTEKAWADFDKAAKAADELAWRMPLHEDYAKFIKGSKVADLFNTDLSGNAGSSSATMFLTNFTEGVEYIHLDVAGTADVKDAPMAPMIKTLWELVK